MCVLSLPGFFFLFLNYIINSYLVAFTHAPNTLNRLIDNRARARIKLRVHWTCGNNNSKCVHVMNDVASPRRRRHRNINAIEWRLIVQLISNKTRQQYKSFFVCVCVYFLYYKLHKYDYACYTILKRHFPLSGTIYCI